MILCCWECDVFILGDLKGPVTPSPQDEGVNPAAEVHCILKDTNPPHLLISVLRNFYTNCLLHVAEVNDHTLLHDWIH
jgi:hypothetical protein